jgi:hypothetical protein
VRGRRCDWRWALVISQIFYVELGKVATIFAWHLLAFVAGHKVFWGRSRRFSRDVDVSMILWSASNMKVFLSGLGFQYNAVN